MPKILGVIHSLEIGGAEKSFCALFSRLTSLGFDTEIIYFQDKQPLQLKGQLKDLKLANRLHQLQSKNPFTLRALLSRKISEIKPDLIISFMDQTNILTLLSLLTLKTKPAVIVCERNNPARNLILSRKSPAALQTLARIIRNISYHFADSICVQTAGAKNYFQSRLKKADISVIPNFIKNVETASNPRRDKKIISVARLVPEKGLEELILAFKKVQEDAPDWLLEIYGQGPLERSLLELIQKEGLQDKIRLLGKVNELQQSYESASIFVLNSNYEGFPNALMEAMAHGCACVARDCDYGPSEIIEHNSTGILLPGSGFNELVSALKSLVSNENVRLKLGQAAKASLPEKFKEELFYESFLALINKCLKASKA